MMVNGPSCHSTTTAQHFFRRSSWWHDRTVFADSCCGSVNCTADSLLYNRAGGKEDDDEEEDEEEEEGALARCGLLTMAT